MVQPVVIQKFARMASWASAGTHYGTLPFLSLCLKRYDENLGPDRSFETSMPNTNLHILIVPTERMRPLIIICVEQLTGLL